MWSIPEVDNEFIKRMDDVLEVYERPYDPKRPVICLDEKSKQLLDEKRESLRVKRGKPKRYDYEYKRKGTVNLFVGIEPKGKNRNIRVTKRKTKSDFARYVGWLAKKKYKGAEKIVLVLDNLNTYNESSLVEEFGEEEAGRIAEKIEWHYTPNHASWLNMAEIEISAISSQCLSQRIPTFQDMQKQVAAWVRERNRKNVGINWQFTRADAQKKFKFCSIGKLKE